MSPMSPTPNPMERVRRIAGWVRLVAVAGGLAMVVGTVWMWTTPAWVERAAAHDLGLGTTTPVTLAPGVIPACTALAMVPVLVGLFALLQVWHLFGHYARGEIFTAEATRRLRRLAWTGIAVAPAQVITRTAIGLVLTMNNPPGKKALVVSMSSNDLTMLLIGLLLLAIAWVMVEATRLARENAEFV